jgi:hypothetical protein
MHWRQKCQRPDRHATGPQANWVLPRHKAIRGARARCPATDRTRNRVTSYHPGYHPAPCRVTTQGVFDEHTTEPQATMAPATCPLNACSTTTQKSSSACKAGLPAASRWSGFPSSARRTSRTYPSNSWSLPTTTRRRCAGPSSEMEDLLQLPQGITGWLMPADGQRHRRGLRGLGRRGLHPGRQDRRTGKQTLLGERVDVATGQADDPEQSAV